MKKFILILCFPLALSAQTTQKSLEKINEEIWLEFIENFNALDSEGFMAIHSNDLLRIARNRGTFRDYPSYNENISGWFSELKNSGDTQKISFRFIERFNDGNHGFEIGIFRVINNRDGKENVYYGKFNVILRQESETWKILVDSDSNENNTIGINDYESAFSQDHFDAFINLDE